ncbi:hypothetical protein J2777_002986 [Paraburkholderia graminis]|nr:hypothetical protein [Paraburkholderia graminis]
MRRCGSIRPWRHEVVRASSTWRWIGRAEQPFAIRRRADQERGKERSEKELADVVCRRQTPIDLVSTGCILLPLFPVHRLGAFGCGPRIRFLSRPAWRLLRGCLLHVPHVASGSDFAPALRGSTLPA